MTSGQIVLLALLVLETTQCLAVTRFEPPETSPFFDLQSQFQSSKIPKSILKGQKEIYCVSLPGKAEFLSELGSRQRHNFSRLKVGTWFNYAVAVEKDGKSKPLGFEKWKIVSVLPAEGQAIAWVLDSDGNTNEVVISRRNLTHEGVRADLKEPMTCLLQETLVGRIQRGQRKAMGKEWGTLQYYRSPLASSEQTVEVVKDVPLGFVYVKEEKGTDTVVRELESFHW